jgi:hypothetical protein
LPHRVVLYDDGMADDRKAPELVTDPAEVPAREADLPVVARLVVEIRSDGRRTVARGAMEDVALGHTVAVQASASSPAQLAFALARAIVRGPSFARTAARGLLRPFSRK